MCVCVDEYSVCGWVVCGGGASGSFPFSNDNPTHTPNETKPDHQNTNTHTQHKQNSARLNMTHGDRAWHEAVIARIRRINAERG